MTYLNVKQQCQKSIPDMTADILESGKQQKIRVIQEQIVQGFPLSGNLNR